MLLPTSISAQTPPPMRPSVQELAKATSGGADWICGNPDHWIYAGTGMKAGDAIPGVIGWEWHGDPAPIPGLEIVATAPTTSWIDTTFSTVPRRFYRVYLVN